MQIINRSAVADLFIVLNIPAISLALSVVGRRIIFVFMTLVIIFTWCLMTFVTRAPRFTDHRAGAWGPAGRWRYSRDLSFIDQLLLASRVGEQNTVLIKGTDYSFQLDAVSEKNSAVRLIFAQPIQRGILSVTQ